jgi:hypothetical protein
MAQQIAGTTIVNVGRPSTERMFIHTCLTRGCLFCDDVVYVYSVIYPYSFSCHGAIHFNGE